MIISRIPAIKTYFWFPDNNVVLPLDSVVYVINQETESILDSLQVPLHFAIKHWFNIIKEWVIYFTIVKKPDFRGLSQFKANAREPKV